MRCIPDGQIGAVRKFLLCQLVNFRSPSSSLIGYTMISSFGWESGVLANSTTYIWGSDLFNSSQFQMSSGSAYTNSRIQVPFTGTIKRFHLKLRLAAGGSAEAVSHFIRINDTTDVAQLDMICNATEVHGTNSTVNQAVTQNDFIGLKIVTPAWSVAPTGRRLWACIYIE